MARGGRSAPDPDVQRSPNEPPDRGTVARPNLASAGPKSLAAPTTASCTVRKQLDLPTMVRTIWIRWRAPNAERDRG